MPFSRKMPSGAALRVISTVGRLTFTLEVTLWSTRTTPLPWLLLLVSSSLLLLLALLSPAHASTRSELPSHFIQSACPLPLPVPANRSIATSSTCQETCIDIMHAAPGDLPNVSVTVISPRGLRPSKLADQIVNVGRACHSQDYSWPP